MVHQSKSQWNSRNTLWEREKTLVISALSPSHTVLGDFYSRMESLEIVCENVTICGLKLTL